ncbi:hypothetical protein P7L78_01295 (plasmid) [Tistrella bauzanensis]|uniref:Stress-induced protein n=1 Tax=Tistrella arctica TaxID=3133430 RepID=A0ABU9YLQ0_9PROT
MANASKKHIGTGAQGKGSGAGAMTDLPPEGIEEGKVLSNRDKSRHTDARGRDGKAIQSDQYQDNEHDQRPAPEPGREGGARQ